MTSSHQIPAPDLNISNKAMTNNNCHKPQVRLQITLPALLMAGWITLASADNSITTGSASTSPAQTELALPDTSARPDAVVAALEQALLHIMQLPDADTADRAAVLEPVLQRTFDFRRMSRFIFGPRWQRFSTAQQEQFINALLELSCASYAANFASFDEEHFTALDANESEINSSSDRIRINRRLITKQQSVVFNYALTRTDQGWQIANIMAKGVSDLALKRSQYSKLYDEGGVNAVLDYIAAQTERLYSS